MGKTNLGQLKSTYQLPTWSVDVIVRGQGMRFWSPSNVLFLKLSDSYTGAFTW